MRRLEADVAVVGSGPAGATFARVLVPRGVRVTLLDAGAQLSPVPGRHLRNTHVHRAAPWTYARLVQGLLHPLSGLQPGRDGFNPAQDPRRNLDGASAAYAVGGMGVHWTAVIPRPHPSLERSALLSEATWSWALEEAERILCKHEGPLPGVRHAVVRDAVADHFEGRLEPTRGVGDLPMAVRPAAAVPGAFDTTGVDDVLGPALASLGGALRIAPEHAVRRLVVRGGRVHHLEGVHLPTGEPFEVHAERFVLAAGTVLSAQLLHVSGVRPRALGRWLVEHPLSYAQVVLTGETRRRLDAALDASGAPGETLAVDPPPNVWVPVGLERPWHVQLTKDPVHFSAPTGDVDDALVVDLRWYLWLEPREDNRVTFAEPGRGPSDALGLPRPTFSFELGEAARARIGAMTDDQREVAHTLGTLLPGAGPRLLPLGTCLHLQGATRMGARDDGASVTDHLGRVWGVDNLRVAGNSVIPTPNACNPTLTTVALAWRSARELAGLPWDADAPSTRVGAARAPIAR